MAKTVFDKILDKATAPKSFDWYRKQVKDMTTPGAKSLITRGKATLRPKYGMMNLFGYDAKHKATLPYYDKFPLIFPIEPAKGGFIGINFHYLPFGARVAFLKQLSQYATDENYDNQTRYNLDWVNNSYFRKTTKRYLNSQVRTSFLNIPANEMAVAIFLPVARFVGGRPY
jgi:hypothetical protein|tara:strand:- start:1012 stop:1524 length:513 start_codon:yes stop_codon:yes gene_type:complete